MMLKIQLSSQKYIVLKYIQIENNESPFPIWIKLNKYNKGNCDFLFHSFVIFYSFRRLSELQDINLECNILYLYFYLHITGLL